MLALEAVSIFRLQPGPGNFENCVAWLEGVSQTLLYTLPSNGLPSSFGIQICIERPPNGDSLS